MELFKQFLRQYWLNTLAIAVFAIDAYRYVQLGEWEGQIAAAVLAFFGMMAVVGAEEMADWSGGYGWTRQTWRVQPTWSLRFLGVLALAWATWKLF